MSIQFLSAESSEGGLRAHYTLSHSTPGRSGTVLDETLVLSRLPSGWKASLEINDCGADTPEEAIAKLTGWLRRLADGLEGNRGKDQLPLN